MALKKILSENGLVTDLRILDVLMTYKNEATEVSTVISELVKVLDSEIIEEYEERVEEGAIKEFVREEQGNKRALRPDADDEVSVLMPKKELMNLFEKARAIEACSIMNKTLFMISQNTLIKYLREDERDVSLEESISILQRELDSEQEKNNDVCRDLEEKQLEIVNLQRLSDGLEREYQELVKEYNDNIRQLKRVKQEAKKLKEKVIELEEIIKNDKQDKRFQKAHDRYPNDQLYKIVIEHVLPYKDQKRLPSQSIIQQLKRYDLVQDFLNTGKFKLDTATNLTNLYDISIQFVGAEYGLTLHDIRSKQTKNRLIKKGKLKEEGEFK